MYLLNRFWAPQALDTMPSLAAILDCVIPGSALSGCRMLHLLISSPDHISKMSSGSSFMSTVPELTGPNYTLWASKSKSWLQSQGIAYVLKTPCPRSIEITSIPAAPAGTTAGATADEAADEPSLTQFITTASGNTADWDKDSDKAMGVIKLCITQAIGAKLEDIKTAKEMWATLKNLYGKPGAAEIFQNFKQAMNVEIPRNAHPGAAIDLIKMYLTRINNAGEKHGDPHTSILMSLLGKLKMMSKKRHGRWMQDKCMGTDNDAEMAEEDDRLSDSLISNTGSMDSMEFQQEKEESTKCLRMWEASLIDMGDSDKENIDPNPRTLQEHLQEVVHREIQQEYNEGLEEINRDLDQMSTSNSLGWSEAQSVTPLFKEISMSPGASNSDVDGDADSMPDLEPASNSLDMDIIALGSDSKEEIISSI
ncbi:hypothetical protein D9758_012784 [Tetrapyrgos nigripes]|uniref:Uncharacterized protein n=1 Tax=Tetrapyrgos nigripes TaxID=182062 RepID=A0A8H5CR98_9AGAR|nr:hypothetical protein D9758_012784 [Tetrapyrgos nigripes]